MNIILSYNIYYHKSLDVHNIILTLSYAVNKEYRALKNYTESFLLYGKSEKSTDELRL